MRIEGLETCRLRCVIERADGTALVAFQLAMNADVAFAWEPDDGSQHVGVKLTIEDMCRCRWSPERCPIHAPLLSGPL